MSQIADLEEVGAERWDAYVLSHPHASLYHQSKWCTLFREVYRLKPFYLAHINDNGIVVGVLPLLQQKSALFGHQLISLPFFINDAGVLADDASTRDALLNATEELAKKLGAERVELRSMAQLDIPWRARESKICMQLTLPDTVDALGKALGSKLRSQIKRPEREGIDIVHGGVECVDDFYQVIACNMRDLGSPVHAKALYQAILKEFPDHAHIVLIKKDNKPVAAAFLIGYKQLLEIPWASSLREYNNIGVNMRLYWEVLTYAIEHGYRIFDFGRSSKDSNTYRFKKQWGAHPVQCYWYNWSTTGDDGSELSNDNPKFQLAIKLWQRMPVALSNFIGPKLVRYLP